MFFTMFTAHVSLARRGPFLCIRDSDGLRHLIRISSVQLVSDADPLADAVLLTAANRTLHLPFPLEEIAAALDPSSLGS